jgi:hypothetical protein
MKSREMRFAPASRASGPMPGSVPIWGAQTFDITPDGKRVFTTINPVENVEQNSSVHVTFLLNFFDELKRRVP